VDPQLLRLILELDSKRAPSTTRAEPSLTSEGTWILNFSMTASPHSSAGEPKRAPAAQNGNGAAAGEFLVADKERGDVKAPAASGGQSGELCKASAASDGGSEQPAVAQSNGNGKPKG
jgi:hypothetical protein